MATFIVDRVTNGPSSNRRQVSHPYHVSHFLDGVHESLRRHFSISLCSQQLYTIIQFLTYHTLEFFFIYKCCIVYETGGRCTNSRWFNSSRDGNLSFSGNLLHEGAILTFVSFPPLICRKRTSLKLSINYFTNLLPEAGIQRAIWENGNMTDGSDWVNS